MPVSRAFETEAGGSSVEGYYCPLGSRLHLGCPGVKNTPSMSHLPTILWNVVWDCQPTPLSKLLGGQRAVSLLSIPELVPRLPVHLTTSISSRRWFTIQNNQLVYQKKYKVGTGCQDSR